MPVLKKSHAELAEIARQIRKDVCLMTHVAKSGHAGGPLSAADYITYLYFNVMNVDPADPHAPGRDKCIISNGHCSALNYAVLAHRGFFNRSYLLTFRSTPSKLQGHPNRLKVPGLEASTGSLGHGLSIGLGLAFGNKLSRDPGRVYVNVGDGELQEGSCWEAIMAAGHYKQDNFCMMVDWNDAQIDGRMTQIMNIEPIPDKLRAFHWHVVEADGHDYGAIEAAYAEAAATKGAPAAIVFKTIMMKGVPPLEDQFQWHGKPLDAEHMALALKELGFNETVDEAIAGYGEVAFHGA
ncbi:MAG TPA: transketolase [bacterium]|nr:transketolase [bacterium]